MHAFASPLPCPLLLRCLRLLCLLGCAAWPAAAEEWRQFRGPSASGQAPAAGRAPASWDAATGRHICWRAALPGAGPSSPTVARGQVFVTCSGGRQQSQLQVLSFSAATGARLWQRTFHATGRTLTHPTSTTAAATPATDGEVVIALFSSADLICLGLDGQLRWLRGLAVDRPQLGIDVGMASSPIIVGDLVIVQMESQGEAFAAGLELATGADRWTIPRARADNWCSPTLFYPEPGSDPVVLLQSGWGISAHDWRTGEQLWQFEIKCDLISSPVAYGSRVFVAADGMTMIEAGGGDPVFGWSASRLVPGACSPIVAGDRLYTVARGGLLNCARLDDGQLLWKLRLGIGNQWSTPAVAADRLYCFGSEGKAAVVDLSDPRGRVLATPDLGEPVKASPAIAEGAVYIRSDEHLWKIGENGLAGEVPAGD